MPLSRCPPFAASSVPLCLPAVCGPVLALTAPFLCPPQPLYAPPPPLSSPFHPPPPTPPLFTSPLRIPFASSPSNLTALCVQSSGLRRGSVRSAACLGMVRMGTDCVSTGHWGEARHIGRGTRRRGGWVAFGRAGHVPIVQPPCAAHISSAPIALCLHGTRMSVTHSAYGACPLPLCTPIRPLLLGMSCPCATSPCAQCFCLAHRTQIHRGTPQRFPAAVAHPAMTRQSPPLRPVPIHFVNGAHMCALTSTQARTHAHTHSPDPFYDGPWKSLSRNHMA